MYSEQYLDALAFLCRQSAVAESYVAKCKAGKQDEIQIKDMNYQLDLLRRAKEQFLMEKEKLGFDDKLSFLQDKLQFQGFQFDNGCLSGDYEHLTDILIPWMDLPQTEENHYKYEVSCLLLSHYFMQEGKYGYPVSQRISLLRKVWNKIICILKKGGSSFHSWVKMKRKK